MPLKPQKVLFPEADARSNVGRAAACYRGREGECEFWIAEVPIAKNSETRPAGSLSKA
jgi:hypothetical protein